MTLVQQVGIPCSAHHPAVRDGTSRCSDHLLGSYQPNRAVAGRYFGFTDLWGEPTRSLSADQETTTRRNTARTRTSQWGGVVVVTPFWVGIVAGSATVAYLLLAVLVPEIATAAAAAYVVLVLTCMATRQKI
jgi:uncharacterized membrane protein